MSFEFAIWDPKSEAKNMGIIVERLKSLNLKRATLDEEKAVRLNYRLPY